MNYGSLWFGHQLIRKFIITSKLTKIGLYIKHCYYRRRRGLHLSFFKTLNIYNLGRTRTVDENAINLRNAWENKQDQLAINTCGNFALD